MPNQNDYVVLLHGLWRTARSMRKLENALTETGYMVINPTYPSRKEKIEDLAEKFLGEILKEKCPDATKKINFVTHSLGGIIVRYFLANHKLKNLGRVVTIAPPNRGSKYADILSRFSAVDAVAGPVLNQLKTDKTGPLGMIPQPDYELGVIAGKYDGKVPPQRAQLKNARDFITVPHTHTFIMNADDVIEAVKKFLENGKF